MTDDKPGEECAVFCIYGHSNAAEMTYLGLYALQHRGQESTGIVTSNGKDMYYHRGLGLVSEVFGDQGIFKYLKGNMAIGHNRYSTTGSNRARNVQPLMAADRNGQIATGHNGNLTNTRQLYEELVKKGAIFQTTLDSELIIHLAAMSKKTTFIDRLIDALNKVEGAYCIVMLTKDSVIAARDPHGFRPLCLGKADKAWVVASETCALDIIGAQYVRDVEPGEIITIDKSGVHSLKPFKPQKKLFCIFEYVYFSRPDSFIFGDCVDKARRKIGHMLAKESPVDADMVISVPDSSNTAALGYSKATGIPFEIGLIRNHYIGRTFIHPSQVTRDAKVRIKFNPIRGVLEGKKIVVVEDSIVRGTTFRKIAKLLRDAGAKEIHLRVSSPPIISPCFYGMDFPTREELLASSMSVEEIRKHMGVDSLSYLSLEGLKSSVPNGDNSYCTACFSGEYPTKLPVGCQKSCLEDDTPNSHIIDAQSLRYEND
ncbi:MAG: amidophosphoribosyltransferase [Candidatus Latescibacteria bacterium]|nr:amidophosphoribosyltransferase [Candidatus Latescibacterota bacterium]